MQRAIEALGQREMPVQAAEQTVATQCGKSCEQAAHVHILTWLEARDGALEQANRRRHALVGPRAGRAHPLRSQRVGAASLRLGRALRAALQGRSPSHSRSNNTAAAHRLAQR